MEGDGGSGFYAFGVGADACPTGRVRRRIDGIGRSCRGVKGRKGVLCERRICR